MRRPGSKQERQARRECFAQYYSGGWSVHFTTLSVNSIEFLCAEGPLASLLVTAPAHSAAPLLHRTAAFLSLSALLWLAALPQYQHKNSLTTTYQDWLKPDGESVPVVARLSSPAGPPSIRPDSRSALATLIGTNSGGGRISHC